MEKVALFAGSFDPFTSGHKAVVEKGLRVFDRVVIGVGVNGEKHPLLSAAKRVELIAKVFEGEERVSAEMYDGLTGDFCRSRGIFHILRGLRSGADLEYERTMELAGAALFPDIETVIVFPPPEVSFVSSSLVREVFAAGGDPSAFLPEGIDLKEFISY